MDRRVTLRELLIARIVLAICIAVYYWCWARNGWENYFSAIQTTVATFAFLFFCFLGVRERKYKANLKRCDSVCYKITMVLIVCIGFLSAILRLVISSEVIGYLLMSVLVLTSMIRAILFCYMDAKGA